MGWKAVKEHYRIVHIVHVRGGKVMIGSPYITEMFVLNGDGSFSTCRSIRGNEGGDIGRYIEEFQADPSKLASLIEQEDTYGDSKVVYSANNGKIVEQMCEEFGFPNVTNDGELMYENTHFMTREEAARSGLRNIRARVENANRHVAEMREKLAEAVAYQITAQQEYESYTAIAKNLGIE